MPETKTADTTIVAPPLSRLPDADGCAAAPAETTLRGCREYGGILIALVYESGVLVADVQHLLGKHSASSELAGSNLGAINNSADLVRLLSIHFNDALLAGPEPTIRLADIRTGVRTGSDGMAAIVSLDGLPPGQALEQGREYRCVCRDADGAEFAGILRYEITRAASLDGNRPAIIQPVVYSDHPEPATDKLNIVAERENLGAPDAAWLKPGELQTLLAELHAAGLPVWGVRTVFSGRYAPAADPPLSSELDLLAGMTGNEFWITHALMRSAELPPPA
jgi:hypothetical protein